MRTDMLSAFSSGAQPVGRRCEAAVIACRCVVMIEKCRAPSIIRKAISRQFSSTSETDFAAELVRFRHAGQRASFGSPRG
jgi:hypothetical protein